MKKKSVVFLWLLINESSQLVSIILVVTSTQLNSKCIHADLPNLPNYTNVHFTLHDT